MAEKNEDVTMKMKKNIALLSSCLLLSSPLIGFASTTAISNPTEQQTTTKKNQAKYNFIITSFAAKVSPQKSKSTSNTYKIELSKLAKEANFMSQSHRGSSGQISYPKLEALWTNTQKPGSFGIHNPNARITLSEAGNPDARMITVVGKITGINYNKSAQKLTLDFTALDGMGFNDDFDSQKTYTFGTVFIDGFSNPF